MNNEIHADDCIKFLIKSLAKIMQEYKRNPSVGLAYEIGKRQKGLDLFPLWNEVTMPFVLKATVMNNAVNRFVYKFIDKNVVT
jgi:hypothetical protein